MITLHDSPDEGVIRQILTEIRSFNVEKSGQARLRTFTVELRDAAGELAGGLVCDLWGYALHIGALWVREDQRRQGQGRELMERAEAYAVAHGSRLAYVETLSFQARPFYEKLGYRVFGTIEGIAPDTDYYFLSKAL